MRQIFVTVMACTLSLTLFGQPGSLDSSFAGDGYLVDSDVQRSNYNDIGVQPSGKLIVCTGNYIGRYNTDGTIDLTFGTSGWRQVNSKKIEVLGDGSILVLQGGSVFKYDINGTIDQTWADNGRVDIELTGLGGGYNQMVIDSKGRIVLGGVMRSGTFPDATYFPSVARLLADGSLDLTFNGGGIRNVVFLDGGTYRNIIDIGVDASDKITAAVEVGDMFDRNDIILKFTDAGRLDLTFGGGDGEYALNADIESLAVGPTGTIVYLTAPRNDQNFVQAIVLKPDGSALGSATYQQFSYLTAAEFQPDGKIVIAGRSTIGLFIARFTAEGKTDSSFATNQGMVSIFPGERIMPIEIAFHNGRMYLSGGTNIIFGVTYKVILNADAFIVAVDATGKRLKCNNFTPETLNPVADAGKCYKTLDNARYNPAFYPYDASGTVNYKIYRGGSLIEQGTGSVNGKNFPVGASQVVYTYTDVTTQTCMFTVNVSDKELPVAKAKNITIQLNASGTATLAAADVNDGSSDACGIQSLSIDKTSFNCSNIGANTVTLTVKDLSNNQSTTTCTVTVEDKIAPEVKTKNMTVYLDAAGAGSISSSDIDDGSSDACGILSVSLDKTSFNCTNKGINTVTLTVTDNNNNSSMSTATVTVVDTLDPVITSVTATPAAIWPPDRKMKNVSVNTSFYDNCPGTTCRITGVVITQGTFPGDNINPDWEITSDNTLKLRAEVPKNGIMRIYSISIACTDAAGNISTSQVNVPVSNSTTIVSARTVAEEISSSSRVNVGASFVNEALNVTVYPNPSPHDFEIRIKGNDKEPVSLRLIDLAGRTLETRIVAANSNINLGSKLAPGVYMVIAEQKSERKVVRLVRQ